LLRLASSIRRQTAAMEACGKVMRDSLLTTKGGFTRQLATELSEWHRMSGAIALVLDNA